MCAHSLFPSFLRRQEPRAHPTVIPAPLSVIPAQAGSRARTQPSFLRPFPSFLRRQEPARHPTASPTPPFPQFIPPPLPVIPAQAGMGGALAPVRPDPQLHLSPLSGGRLRGGSAVRASVGGCSWPRTPHLASPLKGGRDVIGEGGVGGCAVPACAGMTGRGAGDDEEGARRGLVRGSVPPTPHSCLRRNDGERGGGMNWGRGRGGWVGWVRAVPACAGMTGRGAQE